ncbi:hypothetical protein C5167_029562 [Papaver somniferum]|uniref:30S ribosomal protein S9, mitochondrial-like n=1 Tax=Papaver somniferum TaxID=3469 RepID=UPI000E6F59A6|nr:30S ribosomal protein S9, mitochondrial-like [Papaver somniferum]RZC90430.1 hypothetical protein C5167_029562 [Papaver somniferum]
MLSRFISRSSSSSHLRFLTLISSSNPNSLISQSTPSSSNPISQDPNPFYLKSSRYFSSKDKKDPVSNLWRLGTDNDDGDGDSVFGNGLESWGRDSSGIGGGIDNSDLYRSKKNKKSGGRGRTNSNEDSSFASGSTDFFGDIIDNEFESDVKTSSRGNPDGGGGSRAWSFVEDEKDVFDLGGEGERSQEELQLLHDDGVEMDENEKAAANELLEIEKKNLLQQLNGPDRAFGDLIAASGITEEMIESMILLKDLKGVEGLQPLSELKDMPKNGKSDRKSTNAEIERRKQEEVAKARVRQVDDKGRAYGTGRRKCSIARVWVQPGDGRFSINDKAFDVYFPILDHRAAILRPFSETKTLGLWDVKCTVQGGGLSGQVGAIQLGISRALQNWEPGLRPYLKTEGFLTRDSRVVERKKPGLAKARKSFQWVKR